MPTKPVPDYTTLNTLAPHLWVDAHADYLFSYAMMRIQEEHAAKDLVQETFLAGLASMANFEGKSTERTWLTGILKYKIIDQYRKKSSGIKTSNQQAEAGLQIEDFFDASNGHWKGEYAPREFAAVTEDVLQGKEFTKTLEGCINKLPALWASVFVMKHIDEQKTELILTELRLTSANFWVIIHRTKVSLRACLQKNWL